MIVCGAVFGFVVLTRAIQQAATAEADKPVQAADRSKGLADAYLLWQQWKAATKEEDREMLGKQFRDALQKIAADLPEISPERGVPKKYIKLTLNKAKKGIDAFRFRIPEGKATWDLSWEFIHSSDTRVRSFYIIPREGTMQGFESFRPSQDYQEEGADLPKKNLRIVQSLQGGRLKPGGEYIIWFVPRDNEPIELHIRMGLTEAKGRSV
jgi:hypothetical protein